MIKRTVCHVLLIGICVWLGGMIGFSYTINHLRTDPDVKTDAIVVLTGGRNRIGEAVRLLNRGSAEQLLISGVSRGTSLETLKKRQDVKITTSREITLDEKSTNTVENAIEAAVWVKKNNIRSIRLVTSNYHMPRSMAEFRANNRELVILAHPVYSERVEKNWWRSWRSFVLIASEYNKFLYVWIKNRIGRLKED